MSNYNSREQKEYFEQAYNTGSDIWTHIPYHKMGLSMLPRMEEDSLILDVGAGRGLWVFRLVQLGYRVIGIDYVQSIVDRANKDIELEGITGQAKFMYGDVLDIPLTDDSFDATTDIGTMQHLHPDEWDAYVKEISRVTKPGGWYLNISLSRETPRYLDLSPKHTENGHFEKFGVSHYFFTKNELKNTFKEYFVIEKQNIRYFDTKSDPGDSVALLFTLMKRRE